MWLEIFEPRQSPVWGLSIICFRNSPYPIHQSPEDCLSDARAFTKCPYHNITNVGEHPFLPLPSLTNRWCVHDPFTDCNLDISDSIVFKNIWAGYLKLTNILPYRTFVSQFYMMYLHENFFWPMSYRSKLNTECDEWSGGQKTLWSAIYLKPNLELFHVVPWTNCTCFRVQQMYQIAKIKLTLQFDVNKLFYRHTKSMILFSKFYTCPNSFDNSCINNDVHIKLSWQKPQHFYPSGQKYMYVPYSR